MNTLARVVTVVGWILLWAGAAFVIVGIVLTWYYGGFSKVQEIMDPFNVSQYIMTVVVLAPGFALIQLGEWLQRRALTRNASSRE
jgi:hypothetical protein